MLPTPPYPTPPHSIPHLAGSVRARAQNLEKEGPPKKRSVTSGSVQVNLLVVRIVPKPGIKDQVKDLDSYSLGLRPHRWNRAPHMQINIPHDAELKGVAAQLFVTLF